jgi:hypothetical protein
VRRTKTPELIFRRRRSWRTLRGLGAILLILLDVRWDWDGMGGSRCSPLDADHEDELGFSGDIVRAFLLANAGKADLFALSITVFLDVGFGTLEDDFPLLLVGLFNRAS